MIPRRLVALTSLFLAVCAVGLHAADASKLEPEPPVVDPGLVGGPPADAIVLFDGTDLSKFRGEKTPEPKWKWENGVMESTPPGGIFSKEEFGDCQLHVEFATPSVVKGEGQGRGNSGVYLMGRYEIQVLDSFNSKTYPNGQCGAFYGHNAPLVNACRKPGEWQAYDIVFHAPRQLADGKVQSGSFTVLQNGVLIQDHIPVNPEATTAAPLNKFATQGPLYLQDHGNPVRFRNVWIRPLGPTIANAGAAKNTAIIPVARTNANWIQRHESMNQQAKQRHIEMIYVGDSIVEHFDNQGKEVWAHYYAPRHALNLGIGGDRTEHVLWRLDHGNIDVLAPKLAILMIGQNNGGHNTGEEIGAGVTAIVQQLRTKLPKTKILLLGIFQRREKPTPERAVLAQANEIASKLADGKSIFYMDINSIYVQADGSIPRSLMYDFEHPTPLGHRVWAEAIEPEVAQLMGDKPVVPMP